MIKPKIKVIHVESHTRYITTKIPFKYFNGLRLDMTCERTTIIDVK